MNINLTSDGTGQKLYKKAKKIIPGGTQLLSKRPEMFLPDFWPAYYSKAKGASVWDIDNNQLLDMSYCGIGSTVLGYSDPDVDSAVIEAIHNSSMCTLNSYEEVELAEEFLELHPWAKMVRFGRCGGESMAMAIRIARAFTGKDKVVFCGYHGWHDWYLAANLQQEGALNDQLLEGLDPKGVPSGLLGTAIPFHYNNINEFQKVISENKNQIAAVVMEPVRGNQPEEGFL